MARKTRTSRIKAPAGVADAAPDALSFSLVNAVLAAAGLLALAVGYWLLARGSVTAAPLLLVLGYVILLPLAIIL